VRAPQDTAFVLQWNSAALQGIRDSKPSAPEVARAQAIRIPANLLTVS